MPFLCVRAGSVSIRATRYQVRKGTPVVLSGRVESELPAEVVTVYGRKAGAGTFATLGTARPDAGGRWNLRVKPSVGTTHYKAVFEERREPRHHGSGTPGQAGRNGGEAAVGSRSNVAAASALA